MFLTSTKTVSYISEFDTVDHDMLNCQWPGTSDTFRLVFSVYQVKTKENMSRDTEDTMISPL